MAFLLDKGFLMLYICRWFLVDRTGSRYWFSKEEDVQQLNAAQIFEAVIPHILPRCAG
jgi:hypothetical protein